MPKLMLFDSTNSKQIHTITLDIEPYNGEVSFDVIPKTRTLVMECMERSKRNPIYNRHSIDDPNKPGKKRTVPGRPDDAFVQELAKELVQGWDGVVDAHGNEIECTDENKLLLFENTDVANYIVNEAGKLGVVREEEAEDNLKK